MGSCDGPSEPPLEVVEDAETDKSKGLETMTFVASVAAAVIANVPVWLVVPLSCPLPESVNPIGNAPAARLHR